MYEPCHLQNFISTSNTPKPSQKRPARFTENVRKEQINIARKKYKATHPELNRAAVTAYQKKTPEVHRAAVTAYRDDLKSGQLVEVRTEENIKKFEEMMLMDGRIKVSVI